MRFETKRGFDKDRLPSPLSYYHQHARLPMQGKAWRTVLCPFHDDTHASLSIHVDSGGYFCHACGAKGGDVLDFHMQKHGLTFEDAAQELGAWE